MGDATTEQKISDSIENDSGSEFLQVYLVTGGCGFVGSHYLNHAVHTYPNYKFINIDAMYYCASHKNVWESTRKSRNYLFFECNINNLNFVKHIILTHRVTTIVHFAAQSHVDSSFLSEKSLCYTEDNVKGTHSLLEAVRQCDPKNSITFLHFSTDEVYGESLLGEEAKTEMSLMCPTNPYAASKAASELLVQSYHHSYGLKCIITRGNNIIGTNQYPEKLVPKFINLLLSGQKCTIHGSGNSLRSFISVRDVCSAVDCILNKGVVGQIYNIGSDAKNERSVLEVARYLISKLVKTSDALAEQDFIEFVSDRPFNDRRYFINNVKLQKLGWRQRYTFEDEVEKIVKYIQATNEQVKE
jgi:dTDP-glucose 4,6-dehydratase